MAETGIVYDLVTPAGTSTFNQQAVAEYLRLTDVAGMDLAVLGRELQELGARDGVAPPPNAFREALYPAFAGDIVANTLTARRQKQDELRSRIGSITNADGTLKWTPSGASMRQRTVRAYEGPVIRQGDRIDTFQFTLLAPDPLAYSTVEQTSADVTANGAAVNITNGGDAPTWPVLRIYGASTNPILKNNTTGKRLELDYNGGLVIADGGFLEIDPRLSRALLAANLIGNFGFETNATGWTASSTETIARTTAEFRDGVAALSVTTIAGGNSGVYHSAGPVLTAGRTYRAEAWVKAPVGEAMSLAVIRSGAITVGTPTPFTGTGAWQRVLVEFTPATTEAHFVNVRHTPATVVTFFLDSVHLDEPAARTSQVGPLDPLVSEFFQLAVGANAIEFDVTSPGANSKALVFWRDAFWG